MWNILAMVVGAAALVVGIAGDIVWLAGGGVVVGMLAATIHTVSPKKPWRGVVRSGDLEPSVHKLDLLSSRADLSGGIGA